MPGVSSILKTRTGPATDQRAPASTLFISALTERGAADTCHIVRSMAEYEGLFGARVSYGYGSDAAQVFFEEGGTKLAVVRVVGPAATTGFLMLMDKAGSPLATLRLAAKGPGAWSTGVTAAVAAGTVTGTFQITLAYGGATEVYDNLATPADAAVQINKRSMWVTAADQGSATVAPNNQPANLAATALSAGADDRASVVAASYVTALNTYATIDFGAGVVAIPGQLSAAVGAGLLAHAVTNKRIVYTTVAAGSTGAQAISAAQTLRGSTGSERAGLLWPWVVIPDGAGGTRTIPPEAFVAGRRAAAHESEGPWVAPAGELGKARFITGIEQAVNRTLGDQLDAAQVSAIRVIANKVTVYGYRSLSSDVENWQFLTYSDLMNYLEVEGAKRLEQFVFRPIDGRGHLFAKMAGAMVGLVEPIRQSGGLYEAYDSEGDLVDPGYSVDTGPSVNTPTTIANGEARVAVGVRPSPVGALVTLILTKSALMAAV